MIFKNYNLVLKNVRNNSFWGFSPNPGFLRNKGIKDYIFYISHRYHRKHRYNSVNSEHCDLSLCNGGEIEHHLES